jgi:hypothetical protein
MCMFDASAKKKPGGNNGGNNNSDSPGGPASGAACCKCLLVLAVVIGLIVWLVDCLRRSDRGQASDDESDEDGENRNKVILSQVI